MPITEDSSAIGDPCAENTDCPDGYTCQPFNGIVLQQACQILCKMDCECPDGHNCEEQNDKTMIPWFQCA